MNDWEIDILLVKFQAAEQTIDVRICYPFFEIDQVFLMFY